jgi:hypothetical protein
MNGFVTKFTMFGSLVCLNCTIHAQDSGDALLHRAASCLVAKGFFTSSKSQKTLGYFLDTKSYPGEKMLYVVDYVNPSRSDGFVFTIFLSEHNERQNFNIQNNAQFKLSNRGDDGVSFVTPPLGGTWTQEHLISAIKQIEKQPKITISVESIAKTDSSFDCEEYTDHQPKPTVK